METYVNIAALTCEYTKENLERKLVNLLNYPDFDYPFNKTKRSWNLACFSGKSGSFVPCIV